MPAFAAHQSEIEEVRRWRSTLVEPDVQPGCVAGVGFGNDVQVAIAIQIANSRFMIVNAGREQGLRESPPAVSIKDPHARAGLPLELASIGPLGHLGPENIEMSILVDVCKFKAMAMIHVFTKQVMFHPVLSPLEPFETSDTVTHDKHHFRPGPLNNLAGRRPRGQRFLVNQVRLKLHTALMLEPVPATDQVDRSVAVNVSPGQPLTRSDAGNRHSRPAQSLPGISRWTCQIKDARPLHPECETVDPVAGEVAEDLVIGLAAHRRRLISR